MQCRLFECAPDKFQTGNDKNGLNREWTGKLPIQPKPIPKIIKKEK
jgi:hypothetical protein